MKPIAALLLFTLPMAAAERLYVGLTQDIRPIEASAVPGASADAPTLLLIGGMNGSDESARIVAEEVRRYEALSQRSRPFRLLAIPVANPPVSALVFPPTGVAYREHAESHALWRWIGVTAPDMVWIASAQDAGLANALSSNAVAGIGQIPARVVTAAQGLLGGVPASIPRSQAHVEMARRLARSPRQLADELAQLYGHDFDQPTYIFGMALIGRLRLGQTADVERIVAPYVDGTKESLGARPGSTNLSGQLVFAELAQRTGKPRYTELVRKAADLGFTADGQMKESMPFHDEMSDSVFMGTPILVQAGKLTGERKYFDMAARHFAFMEKLDLRPDGIYRHSPLSEAAWGRGNAFAALGLELTLNDFPKDHPAYGRIAEAYRKLMTALAPYQGADGMWHEVIDQPASYGETSATSMIAFSILRGIHNGWLDAATWQPRVDKAWNGVLARIGPNGVLMDVCESTGKQKSVEDYLHRAASLGHDDRGGAMALLLATELLAQ